MIEQLMIGNYVSLEYNNSNKIYEILEIKHSSATISNIMNRDDFGENQYHNIYGIPLTEDILIRCGFEKIYKSDFKTKYELKSYPFIEVVWNHTYHWHVRLYGINRVEINTLHKLQNLVKLLCNQTIELK